MRLSETREAFANRLTFPTDRDTVVDRVGDVTLDSPNGESETVAAVLDRSDAAEFASSTDLYLTVVGAVDEGFVGRKHYDDRGEQTGRRENQQSF